MLPERVMSPPCPKCGNTLSLNTEAGLYRCAECGFRRPETLDEAAERLRQRGQRPSAPITHRGSVDLRARTLFENGQDALWRDDKPAALRAFQQSLDVQRDFADAHLWIARISDDERVKRDHLGDILAHDPGHLEALRMMLVLNGTLTAEEAELSRQERAPRLQRVPNAVQASVTTPLCPVCGGGLTVDETNGRVLCRFCGHSAPLDTTRHASAGAETLGTALLKRRIQPVQWQVGAHILHCSRCGAERTIPAGRLSTTCPFCASTQVIERDALGTFEQPDGLLPFSITEAAAQEAIRQRLNSMSEKVAGLFNENRVKGATMDGIYLPFWVFDAVVEVSRTTTDRRTPERYDRAALTRAYENVRLSDGVVGVPVAGVRSPALAQDAGEFDLSGVLAYEPKLLAKYPAALYDIDFDAASLTARSLISERMRRLHGENTSRSVEVQVFTSVLQMSFTLLLLPVWVATLYERDGDLRPALVNGQSGRVVLGKAAHG